MSKPKPSERVAAAYRETRDWVRDNVPPGLRLVLGLLLIVGGVLGFLPILGFWMIPLGVVVVLMDVRLVIRAVRSLFGSSD